MCSLGAPEYLFVPDDLDALGLLPVLLQINMLNEEKAPFHPLVGNPSACVPGHFPGADQSVQASEIRVRRGWLLIRLPVGVVCHHHFSCMLLYDAEVQVGNARAFDHPGAFQSGEISSQLIEQPDS